MANDLRFQCSMCESTAFGILAPSNADATAECLDCGFLFSLSQAVMRDIDERCEVASPAAMRPAD